MASKKQCVSDKGCDATKSVEQGWGSKITKFCLMNRDLAISMYTRVYPKYSRLVPPPIQQLWWREAPVDGRTTMSIESVCLVARSWVEVGSFHNRLVVRFVIFAASVRNILVCIRDFLRTTCSSEGNHVVSRVTSVLRGRTSFDI
jgi:hypothetical protein